MSNKFIGKVVLLERQRTSERQRALLIVETETDLDGKLWFLAVADRAAWHYTVPVSERALSRPLTSAPRGHPR